MRRFRFLRNPRAAELGDSAEEFLRRRGGPASLLQEGRDRSRTRALVTLLHGNEPSGVMAVHRWLRASRRPAVNALFIIASVPAALEPPLFSQRMLPRARDLNRCFRPPFDDAQGELAEEILEILHLHQPEAVVDMHNTSASGPAFGVCSFRDRRHDALSALFTQRLVLIRFALGALMEISEHSYPTVTVEVGGRLDSSAHAVAREGLERFLSKEEVFTLAHDAPEPDLLQDPVRLELRDRLTLTYADAPRAAYDVTLRAGIERLNFGTVREDTLLGWADAPARELFTALDRRGRCAVDRLLRSDRGRLYPAQALRLFMITDSAAIASSDCLWYATAQDGSSLH